MKLTTLCTALSLITTIAARAHADDVAGHVMDVTILPDTSGNVRASATVYVGNGSSAIIEFVGGTSETATHPTLNRRELSTRIALVAAAKADISNNKIYFYNLTKVSGPLYRADRNSRMEIRFNADSRWYGAVAGWRKTVDYTGHDIYPEHILGMGITKEPDKTFDVEYVIVRMGNEHWNVYCLGDSNGVNLDAGVQSTTPAQREQLLMLATQYDSTLSFGNVRHYRNHAFYLHRQTEIGLE